MINIAIVEDKLEESNRLKNHLLKYEEEKLIKFLITVYNDAETFLKVDSKKYDLVFFDIELGEINGIDAAFEVREKNNSVQIIFVTNMSNYAIQGYKVDAIDYILKPIEYHNLISPLERALNLINDSEVELIISQPNGFIKVSSKDIIYVEVRDHRLTYHTKNEAIKTFGSLKAVELSLTKQHFMRCNSCYLVNPQYIHSVEGNNVVMKNGDELKISRPRKKNFMLELATWIGKGNFV